jgi:hypothetical protein
MRLSPFNSMLNKDYFFLIASTFFFVICLGYSLFLYATWNADVDEDVYSLEINLPVISWESYLSLSKQPE